MVAEKIEPAFYPAHGGLVRVLGQLQAVEGLVQRQDRFPQLPPGGGQGDGDSCMISSTCSSIIANGRYLAKTEASQKLNEINGMTWIAELTFCGGNLQNPILSDDTLPGYHFA